MNLDLSKTNENEIFADQTPTPTRLIKNCEEFGVFDDLNPFDKSFEAAQKGTLPSEAEDSLHTPQVFPALTGTEEQVHKEQHNSPPPNTALDILPDLTPSAFRQISPPVQKRSKYRKIAEKPSIAISAPIQIIQPVIELQCNAVVPSQGVVKPLILAANVKKCNDITVSQTHERSSASLTPTSQLPIKERLKLKAIQSKARREGTETNSYEKCSINRYNSKTTDCLDRRRAAAARYRNKIKYEFKELRRQNSELRTENGKLREHVQQLQKELSKHNSSISISQSNNIIGGAAMPVQLRIPPSTVHLVMNIPQLLITPAQPTNGK